jgi:hypothetical protein
MLKSYLEVISCKVYTRQEIEDAGLRLKYQYDSWGCFVDPLGNWYIFYPIELLAEIGYVLGEGN